jgi:hypothetical protein
LDTVVRDGPYRAAFIDSEAVAPRPTHIAIRDSKDPTAGTLAIPADAFASFIQAIRTQD